MHAIYIEQQIYTHTITNNQQDHPISSYKERASPNIDKKGRFSLLGIFQPKTHLALETLAEVAISLQDPKVAHDVVDIPNLMQVEEVPEG